MSARSAIVVALAAVSAMSAGCNCSRTPGARPGTEPLPSSQPVMVPGGGLGARAPLRGKAADLGPRGRGNGIIARVMEEEERRQGGPERLSDPAAEGRRIATEMLATLPTPSEEGPCVDAWNAWELTGTRGGRRESRAEFLERCRQLPPALQRCMSPLYFRDHGEECSNVSAEQGERLERSLDEHVPNRPRT